MLRRFVSRRTLLAPLVRSHTNNVNPTSEYIPSTFDRPRYSLKRFNMQLSQSIFCRSPNLQRTHTICKVMDHDGVKGDRITFFLLFNAIKVHELWDNFADTYDDMKNCGVEVDHDIYVSIKAIGEASSEDVVRDALEEIQQSGYVHVPVQRDYPSNFFEPVIESQDFIRE